MARDMPPFNPAETPREVYRRLRHQGRDDQQIATFLGIGIDELRTIAQDEEVVHMRALD